MSGEVAPRGAAHEQSLTVLELVRAAVPGARGAGDRERRDLRSSGRRAQFRLVGQIANDRDNGFSSHYAASLTSSFFLKLLMNNWACQSVNLA